MKIAFFDTHSFEKEAFSLANKKFNFDIEFLDARLVPATAKMAEGADAVCSFVNDKLDATCLKILKSTHS